MRADAGWRLKPRLKGLPLVGHKTLRRGLLPSPASAALVGPPLWFPLSSRKRGIGGEVGGPRPAHYPPSAFTRASASSASRVRPNRRSVIAILVKTLVSLGSSVNACR